MSTIYSINESLTINNINNDTLGFAETIKTYLVQISGMHELQSLRVSRILLSVDGEEAELKDLVCYEESNRLYLTDEGFVQQQAECQAIPADHPLFTLADKLPGGREIKLTAEYEICHSCLAKSYGADFFGIYLKDKEEALSPYVTYVCREEYPEEEVLNMIKLYRFDESFCGTVPYKRNGLDTTEKRDWVTCGFTLLVSAKTDAEKKKAAEAINSHLSRFGFDEAVTEDGLVGVETGTALKDTSVSELINTLEAIRAAVADVDSTPDICCEAITTDGKDLLSVKIYVENGKLVTEWCR